MIVYYDSGDKPVLRSCFIDSGVHRAAQYRSRAILKLDRRTRGIIRPRSLVYENPRCPDDDDKIIAFDTWSTSGYLRWLCAKNPSKRIILWFWNPVANIRTYDTIPRKVEIWSYSPDDCEKYGLRYNSQFYFDSVVRIAAEEPGRPWPSQPRALFLGRAKGREEALSKLDAKLVQAGAVPDFHIMKDHLGGGTEEPVPYPQTYDFLRAADVLVDLYNDPRAGFSLRPMEAMFWNKKLVTNNIRIIDADFFNPRNIYVLGEDERSLEEFLSEPPVPVPAHIRDYYLLSNWLKRFDE